MRTALKSNEKSQSFFFLRFFVGLSSDSNTTHFQSFYCCQRQSSIDYIIHHTSSFLTWQKLIACITKKNLNVNARHQTPHNVIDLTLSSEKLFQTCKSFQILFIESSAVMMWKNNNVWEILTITSITRNVCYHVWHSNKSINEEEKRISGSIDMKI